MRFRIGLGAIVLTVLVSLMVYAQGNKTYTCTWDYNYAAVVDTWQYSIDGTVSSVNPTCTGSYPSLHCTAPITLSLGVTHSVIVIANNAFGSASSVPFITAPPGAAVVANIK